MGKTSKIDQLVDRVELACSVLNFRKTISFGCLPKKFQDMFERILDDCAKCGQGYGCAHVEVQDGCDDCAKRCGCPRMAVQYSDPTDDKFSQNYKNMLYDFCIKQEKKERKKMKIEK